MGCRAFVAVLVLLSASGLRADVPCPDLASWSDAVVAGVAQTGAEHPAAWRWAGPGCGRLGRYFAELAAEALARAERWEVADTPLIETALATTTVPAGESLPEALADALSPLGVDAVVTGRLLRSDTGLRIETVVVQLPHGPRLPLPAAEVGWDADLLALAGASHGLDETRALRPKLADVVARSEPASDRVAPVLDPAGLFGLQLIVAGGIRAPESREGEAVVAVEPDEEYVLRLTNRSSETVGVALFVDGLNTVGQKVERPSAGPKWLVEPGRSIDVAGWQIDGQTRRPFTVVEGAQSVAADAGEVDALGLITASYFAAASSPRVGDEVRDLPIGTGQGAAEASTVERVKFAAAAVPAATLTLRYEVKPAARIGQ